MKTIEIYEPPLCCPTGLCGPAPDPELAVLMDTVIELRKEGHSVERIAINQQPMRVMNNPVVKAILLSEGKEALPITLVEGKLVLKGRYPRFEDLR